jgi:O-antigen biosynthesis protein
MVARSLLTATNYIGRFWCALASVLRRTRATMGDWFEFGDYDLVLRCTEETSGIHHVPKLLCERGRPQLDHPDQERAALARAVGRRTIEAAIGDGSATGYYRVKHVVDPGLPVSVVIAVQLGDDRIEKCIRSLRATNPHRRVEIICVVNRAMADDPKSSLRQHADTVVSCDEPYNRSQYDNLGAREAASAFLLFLSEAAVFTEPGWIDALLEHAARDEVGAVGGRLLDVDGVVAHAGMFWTPAGARDAFRGTAADERGYFGLAHCERNVSAVAGACLLVRRTVFDQLGGFDESFSVNGDIDFCLRCGEQGKAVISTPHARLTLDELPSRRSAAAAFEEAAFESRWGRKLLLGDPFYHRGLGHDRDDFTADREPTELVFSSRPLFDRARIRNILAVKLDHIGDFVTAIPALGRLQQHFPQARLYLLASPGVAELTHLVPGLAGAIEFEFFFARSGAGQRELAQADFQILQQRLHPYQFDLAIDFRKAPETRPILRESGARWLAGFDHNGQFPWLDVVMEWEGDPPGARKRSHVGDDLLRLVDAVAIAGEARPDLPRRPNPAWRGSAEAFVGRKIVCVHPGVGSAIRQWPAKHFSALIDLLATSYDVEILLIGSGDEIAIAEEVLAQVQHSDVVRSLVGEVSLRDLPDLLASVDLFVGNNSGPKHLAAGLGVPTVGIHSGTVHQKKYGLQPVLFLGRARLSA